MISGAFFSFVAFLLYAGWSIRDAEYLTAESGMGYALGIVGGVMMLLLLLYPVRKRVRFLRAAGHVKYWFRTHMTFGLLGPTAVLYHANFGLGALNSNVALFCMLGVAGSGIIGRFIYTGIHYGLYGAKADLESLKTNAMDSRFQLAPLLRDVPAVADRMQRLEGTALRECVGLGSSLWRVFKTSVMSRWAQRAIRRAIKRELVAQLVQGRISPREQKQRYAQARAYLVVYMTSLRKVAGLQVYERLFALWHVLHLPLFIMLIVSGVAHVIFVHLY